MSIQLIFVVETNKTCKSDWIYIKDTIDYFFEYDRTAIKLTPVYMYVKGKYKNKEKEIYDLKHDLISNQVKTETAEESLKKLERDNKELLLNKARLEAALEDKLLDGKDSPKESEKENTKKK